MVREAQARGDPYAVSQLPEPDSTLLERVRQRLWEQKEGLFPYPDVPSEQLLNEVLASLATEPSLP